jgi:HSP20 family protein
MEEKTTASDNWQPEEVPQLTVDVYRKENMIYIVSTVAGVRREDIDISIDGNNITIRGNRRRPYAAEQGMLLEECFWGEFSRELTISETFDIEKVGAKLENGVLTVEVPVIITSGHKKVPVEIRM